ncbi:hypothetical protein [Sphingomonas antarctica]|uniref:hypothetical protein n=1 Tax=Sphingomonas antarctica TaxID=2040274 RepID=UPI0039E9FB52
MLAIDADGFNRTFTQRLGQRDATGTLLLDQDPYNGVAPADLFARDGAAPIFEAIETDARVVVVDTPAGGLKQSKRLSENLTAGHLVQHCLDNDRTPLVLVPFGPTMASIRGIGEAIETFGSDAHIVAIRSNVGVDERDYRLWKTDPFIDRYGREIGGRTRKLFEEVGGRLIEAPALAAGPNAMAEALCLTYGEAATYKGPNWQTYDGLNVRNWLNSWVTQLQTIADLLAMEDVNWKAF